MSCQRCGTDMTNLDLCWNCRESEDLKEKVTTLKAERDEAVRTRDDMQQLLFNLLARIHRDGGHYTNRFGVTASVMKADELVVAMLKIVDQGHCDAEA